MKVRRAVLQDVPALLALKNELRFAGSARGGFLLGSTEANYRERVREGEAWVLEARAEVLGFATTLSARSFSQTPLWELRNHVRWTAPSAVPNEGVGYFDQLAVRRGSPARATTSLAFVALYNLFTSGSHVVTTTVVSPARNEAAVPLIELVGGVHVGELDEVHENFGPLTSAVWLLTEEQTTLRVTRALQSGERSVLASVAHAATREGLVRVSDLERFPTPAQTPNSTCT